MSDRLLLPSLPRPFNSRTHKQFCGDCFCYLLPAPQPAPPSSEGNFAMSLIGFVDSIKQRCDTHATRRQIGFAACLLKRLFIISSISTQLDSTQLGSRDTEEDRSPRPAVSECSLRTSDVLNEREMKNEEQLLFRYC